MVLYYSVVIVPPHQGASDHFIGLGFFPRQPLPSCHDCRLACDLPLPSGEMLMAMNRECFNLKVMDVAERLLEVLCHFTVLHSLALTSCRSMKSEMARKNAFIG